VVAADDGKATSLGESYAIVKGKFRKKSTRANLPVHTHANMAVVAEDNLAHSLWDRCTLHANGQEIFHTSNYAQMAYMQTLIHKTEDEKTTSLAVEGWLPSSEEPAKDFAGIGDAAKAVRKEKIAAGKKLSWFFAQKFCWRILHATFLPEQVFVFCSTKRILKRIVFPAKSTVMSSLRLKHLSILYVESN
jgi:hypothetical protein